MDSDTDVFIELTADTNKTLVNIGQFVCFDNLIGNSSVHISLRGYVQTFNYKSCMKLFLYILYE